MPNKFAPPSTQRGISLITIMVLLLLSTIVVLGVSRTNLLNESLVGNESDYQRAYTAAEALIADAEADIRGVLVGGAKCQASANFDGCRNRYGANAPFFPTTITYDWDDAIANLGTIAAGSPPCRNGICIADPPNDFALGADWWLTPANVNAMTAAGIPATYGQYTGANGAADTTGNPLLRQRADGTFQAWYWVEVLPYNVNLGAVSPIPGVPIPSDNQPFVYRITAIVNGLKPGTQVALRSLLFPMSEPLNQRENNMKKTHSAPSNFRLHSLASAALVLVVTSAAHAAPMSFGQVPAGSTAREPAPNIIISVDDSGSMGWDINGCRTPIIWPPFTATWTIRRELQRLPPASSPIRLLHGWQI